MEKQITGERNYRYICANVIPFLRPNVLQDEVISKSAQSLTKLDENITVIQSKRNESKEVLDRKTDDFQSRNYITGKMATCSNKPRPTCLKEQQNYTTLDRLLKDVAEPVVRKRFDKEFDPTALQKTLNRESFILKKLVNRKQWNILFPPRG
ncbi:unnamed protein product [Mytilus edulis]|uniref:Uncharacterized protein n=1 Tax=Mytilus edulis TaxID=6550 RepID=A0A8S3SPA4_MYTED|nr:unnamed protein product [Mytilus edulis]